MTRMFCDRCGSEDRVTAVSIVQAGTSANLNLQRDLCYDCKSSLREFMHMDLRGARVAKENA